VRCELRRTPLCPASGYMRLFRTYTPLGTCPQAFRLGRPDRESGDRVGGGIGDLVGARTSFGPIARCSTFDMSKPSSSLTRFFNDQFSPYRTRLPTSSVDDIRSGESCRRCRTSNASVVNHKVHRGRCVTQPVPALWQSMTWTTAVRDSQNCARRIEETGDRARLRDERWFGAVSMSKPTVLRARP